MHRLLSPRTHGFIDYGLVALLLLAPALFGFSGAPAILCFVLAFAQLGMSLITAYPLSLAKVIPFKIHGGIELGAGVLALISPWLFGFSAETAARNFFLFAGVSVALTWAATNYSAAAAPTGFCTRQRIRV